MPRDWYNRSSIYYYMERIPDATQEQPYCNIPCDQAMPNQEGFQRSACLARQHQMYLVTNLVENLPCENKEGCPSDGHYQFNTNMIFDPNGCLIGKYRKTHLYSEEHERMDKALEASHVYFDTEYGRFGTFICMDILFHDPAITLVEEYGVQHVICPAAWNNSPDNVWLRSLDIQFAFAKRMGVNFLASNIQRVEENFAGTGIFTPEKPVNYTYNMEYDEATLIIGRLTAKPEAKTKQAEMPIKRSDRPWLQWIRKMVTNIQHIVLNGFTATKPRRKPSGQDVVIYGNTYKATPLVGLRGHTSVCYGCLCCNLEYRRSSEKEFFILGAFVGMQVYEGTFHVEVRTVIRCPGNDLASCEQPGVNTSSTSFQTFNLYGNFNADYVFPALMTSGFTFDKIDWNFIRGDNNYNAITFSSGYPFVSAAMMRRDYRIF